MIKFFIKNKVFLILLIVFCVFVLQNIVLAQQGNINPPATPPEDGQTKLEDVGKNLGQAGEKAGFINNPKLPVKQPEVVIGKIINIALGLLGVIFLCLIVYAGYLWMTASGNDDQLKKAKGILTNSIIGLIIVLMAYIISAFVIKHIIDATSTPSPSGGVQLENPPLNINELNTGPNLGPDLQTNPDFNR